MQVEVAHFIRYCGTGAVGCMSLDEDADSWLQMLLEMCSAAFAVRSDTTLGCSAQTA